jgi:hypothetical protein
MPSDEEPTMTSNHDGGCRCGRIRYEIAVAPIDVRLCHCRDCQYASGSAFSAIAYFPAAAVALHGETRGYVVKGSADLSVDRHFCPDCGTPIFSRLLEMPDLLFMKVGSLDDPDAVEPSGHIWCDSMVGWLRLGDTLERLPGNPPL